MPYDIFISYAHHDNRTHGQWVEKFSARLTDYYYSCTGERLSIFFDREGISPGDSLKPSLKKALLDSAIFMPILSPPYLSSHNCCEEFDFFKNEAGNKLWLEGNSCRIVPLRLMPYERAKGTPLANGIREFLSEKGLIYQEFFDDPRPMPPEGERFENAIVRLSGKIEQLLDKFRKPPTVAGRAIFLAHTTKDSRSLRDSLLKELQQLRKHGKLDDDWRILPEEAPDMPANIQGLSSTELEEFIQRQLNQAMFSIHLFDDLEGIKTTDTREPVVQLQYRLAKAEALRRPGLTLLNAISTTEECSTQQETFISTVEADALEFRQVEVLASVEFLYIRDHLLDKINSSAKNIREDSVLEADAQSVFFVHDHQDTNDEIRKLIKSLIDKHEYEVIASPFAEDQLYAGGQVESYFQEAWSMCSRALILLRFGSTGWCNAIRVKLMKYAKHRRLHDIAICVTDPDAASRIEYVRSGKLLVIDCTQPDFEREITVFLKPA